MKQTEKKYQCIPFWSWNDELDEEGLCKQIEWMNDSGVGGFFMHARGGLKTEYLGEKWFDCIKACSEKAEELGMEAYAYDENGWPSGFVGGKLLEDIENHDQYLTFTTGAYDEKALVAYDMSGEKLVRVTKGDNCLNVFVHYAASTADILNPEVVDKFIAMTHEEYKKRDTYNLKGFFTDEPQYYRWGTSFTKVLPTYFKETYGEDILDGLGLLFVEKEGYRAFRYKYWKAMQALMLNNFAKKVYDWCDENGYFWYVGRSDDVIKTSGYRVGPFEVESVIMELPYVLECAVTGAPDPTRGQVIKAWILLVKGTQESEELKKEIQEYVKVHTAPYKYPRLIEFVSELPKTTSGKIRRTELRNR